MNIAENIQRITDAKNAIKSAIENKGVEVGDVTIDEYASKINSIQQGEGGGDTPSDDDWQTNPFWMMKTSNAAGDFQINSSGQTGTKTFEYKVGDDGEWTELTVSNGQTKRITAPLNTKVYLRSNTPNFSIAENKYFFIDTYNVFDYNVGGNILSLIGGNNMGNYAFAYLLRPRSTSTALKDASELVLPNHTTRWCFLSMFANQQGLKKAPALPAKDVHSYSYSRMFFQCKALTDAPELPATTLENYCYDFMFQGCTSLVNAPDLPATDLANYCYNEMFRGCSKLTKAPKLPATTLASSCYYRMFYQCTSLTTAPELPATTLASSCYYQMFYGCSKLLESPELPATTLTGSCYYNLFMGCASLKYIKALFTTTPSNSYTNAWVTSVASSGTFVKNIKATWTTTGTNAVPSGWTVIYYDTTDGKYYISSDKEQECDKYGNVI